MVSVCLPTKRQCEELQRPIKTDPKSTADCHVFGFVLQVHDYLRGKLCSLYENDCIFDKFECVWNGSDR